MSTYLSQLGDQQSDEIIRQVLDNARTIFPVQTAQAEEWINSELMKYGISYAKYQAEQSAMGLYPWIQSPLFWVAGAVLLAAINKPAVRLYRRRKRK